MLHDVDLHALRGPKSIHTNKQTCSPSVAVQHRQRKDRVKLDRSTAKQSFLSRKNDKV